MKRNRAFTLVELLVVIGIIATLIAILLPTLNKARQSSNSLACQAHLRSIGQGIAMYENNWKGCFPEGVGPQGADTWVSILAYDMRLDPYAQNMNMSKGAMGTSDTNRSLGVFLCPDAIQVAPTPFLHYSCHPLLMPTMQKSTATYPTPYPPEPALAGTQQKPYKITHVPHSADIVLVFDGTQGLGAGANVIAGGSNPIGTKIDGGRFGETAGLTPSNPGVTYLVSGYQAGGANVSLGDSIDGGLNKDAPPASNAADIRWRHMNNTRANFLYVDGHVASLRYNSEFNTELTRYNVYVPAP